MNLGVSIKSIPMVIGVMGGKGAGKDTLANYLVSDRNFKRIAFADALYKQVADAFKVTVEFLQNRDTKELPLSAMALKNCKDPSFVKALIELNVIEGNESDYSIDRSPRQIMQWWGTEYRRKSSFGYDAYWLDIVKDVIDKNPNISYVITDVRFNNEADFIDYNAAFNDEGNRWYQLWRVLRPKVDEAAAARREAGDPTALHPSETDLLNRPASFTATNIENDFDAIPSQIKGYFDQLT